MGLSAGQRAFIRVFEVCGPQFSMHEVRRHKLIHEYRRARNAGFFQNAGIVTTVKAEDWLNSEAGREALRREQ